LLRPSAIVPVLTILASLAFAGSAVAAPSGKDVRRATAAARTANAAAVDAARGGDADASRAVRRAVRRDARAARLADRAAAHRGGAGGARVLRIATAGVDGGIDGLAPVLGEVPPELQEEIAAALERLHGLRDELIAELTGLVDTLPPDVRDQVLAAISRFESDGDLEALVDALGDPDVVAAVRDQLEDLIGEVTDSIRDHLDELEESLPPGALDELEAVFDRISDQLDEVLDQLAELLGDPGEPPVLSGDLCTGLEQLLAELGFPLPPGVCPAAS